MSRWRPTPDPAHTFIQEWSARAPWPDLRQVEQDLVIGRALCDLFGAPALAGSIAFRGGTAIHKLLFKKPLRYSEDIDLVQTRPEPIGATLDGQQMARRQADIASFEPEELFGTKLRALLQRRKGRDLLDLDEGLRQLVLDPRKFVACFEHYLALEGNPISRAGAERRMLEKLTRSLTDDISPLLPAGVRFSEDDAIAAFGRIWARLIARLRGEPWKLSGKAIEELRQKKHPGLLRDGGAGG